jgi:hypothetical protein
MPLYKLLEEMPYDEFCGWIAYFDKRPMGWQDDLRTSYIMKSFGDKRSPADIFPSLSTIFKPKTGIDTLQGSALFGKLMNAKNGVKLSVD